MAQSRLSKILEQEYKTKGLIGGASSAMGKRALEKLDVRNALFGGSGLGSIIGRKIFGRGYSATRGASSESGLSSASAQVSSLNNSLLEELNVNSKISAKNSMALPSMARDMNVMRQNIIKMVKLQGGTATNKADAWFMKSKDREAAYESQFGRKSSTSPSKVEVSAKGGESGGILGFLGNAVRGIGTAISGLAQALGSVIASSIKALGETLSTAIKWLAGALAAAGLGRGRGGVVSVPGGKGKKKPGGKWKGRLGMGANAALLGILGYELYDQLFGNDDESSPNAAGGEGVGPNGEPLPNQTGTNWKNVATNAGMAALGTAGAVATTSSIMSRSAVQGYNAGAKRFVDSSGKFTAAKKIPGGEMLKKFIDFAVKAQSKGWMGKIFGKLAVRVGTSVAMKAMTFLGGLAVPGVGWAASAISLAMLAYDAYIIYDAIFGDDGILKELEKEDSKSTAPTPAGPAPTTAAPTAPTAANADDYSGKVGSREGGRAGYDAIFGFGGPGGDPSIRAKYGKNLSEMTIGEALAISDSRMNENRGAMGKYGFMPSTIRGLLKPSGLTEKDVFSPENQEKLMAELTRRNAIALRQQGIEPTQANLDLAHSVGAGGAAKLLAADPNAKANDVLGLKGYGRSTNPQLDTTVAAYLRGKELLHGSSALAKASNQPPVVVVQNGNNTQTPGGTNSTTVAQIQTADVLDSELGKLLLARVYGMS